MIQLFAIILTIPFSFIGIFLTFSLFDITFDLGGYASFLLLTGVTVHASIFIINDFNNLKRKYHGKKIEDLKIYLKVFNSKIVPIVLTIISTILGLCPFLFFGQHEVFWFALAVGTIGGLLFSLLVIII